MARLTVFEAGYCTHPGCVALRGASCRPCKFPARAWLIEAGERRWLWDTGYANHFHDHTRNGVFRLYPWLTPVHFDSSDSLREQLARRGISPGDVSGLIVSHFHGDHVAGLRDFPEIPILCSGHGWKAMRPLRGFAAVRQGFVPGLMPPDFEPRVRFVESFAKVSLPAELAPFRDAFAVPGSEGQVLLVELPGHAAGQLGAFVLTDNGWVLLAADAAWSDKSYRELRRPSRLTHLMMDCPSDYYTTIERLHQLSLSGRVPILLTHEGYL
jgi:glyoxylase-like metal-dependent hydrolase (beta-lactamase superfamily II)